MSDSTKTFQELAAENPNLTWKELVKVANARGIEVSNQDLLRAGTRLTEAKRGKGDFKPVIEVPSITVDGKKVAGVKVDKRVARLIGQALLDAADKLGL